LIGLRGTALTSTTLLLSVALTLVFAAACLVLVGGGMALGVLIGGTLMVANFKVLQWSVTRLLSGGIDRGAGGFLVVFFLKLLLLGGLLSLAILSGKVHVLGLFLGCSVVVAAVLCLAPVLGVQGLNEDGGDGGRD
jgi:ATP synthase I chain